MGDQLSPKDEEIRQLKLEIKNTRVMLLILMLLIPSSYIVFKIWDFILSLLSG